jgi:small subunit ribosomal protein S18
MTIEKSTLGGREAITKNEQINNFKKQQFNHKRRCPFSGNDALKIDYKDVTILSKFLSERGKIIPSRVTSVCFRRQRELARAVKRARFLALIPYVNE